MLMYQKENGFLVLPYLSVVIFSDPSPCHIFVKLVREWLDIAVATREDASEPFDDDLTVSPFK